MAEGENKLELLQSESSAFENLLNELKKETLSENVRKQKEKEAKDKAEKLQGQIDGLRGNKGIDEKLEAAIDRAQGLLVTYAELSKLQDSIGNKKETTNQSTSTGTEAKETGEKEEKGRKWREWTKDKWSKVPKGCKWALGAVGAAITGTWFYKKFFGKKNEEKGKEGGKGDEQKESNNKEKGEKKETSETSWWKKFSVGAIATVSTAFGGVRIYKHWNKLKGQFKDILGLNPPFDEARKTVEAQVYAGINKDSAFGAFNADFKGISYNESSQTVSSYGEETKIDYKNKKIDGLPVEFPDWEQLLHAANLVNFAKRKLQGRGKTEKPFNIGKIDGDLSFDAHGQGNEDFVTGSASNFWATLLGSTGAIGGGLLGGYFGGLAGAGIGAVGLGTTGYLSGSIMDENSTLRKICDTLKTNPNLGYFANYLNDLKDSQGNSLWKYKNQKVEQQNKTPLQKYINKLITELNNDYYEEGDNGIRNLKAEMDKDNPEKFWVSSYNGVNDDGNNKVCITLKGCKAKQGEIGIDFSKVSTIHIEKYQKNDLGNGLNIKFPNNEAGLKEAIRTVNLTNKIRFHYKKNCADKYPFAYGKYNVHGFLQFQKNALDVDKVGHRGDTIVYHDELENNYPTIAKDLEEYEGISGCWNSLFNNDGEQQRMAKNAQVGTPESKKGSQYIRYLHQMRDEEDSFWKKNTI